MKRQHKAHSVQLILYIVSMRMKWESVDWLVRVNERKIFLCVQYIKLRKRIFSQWIVANEDDKWNWMPCKAPTIYFYSSFWTFQCNLVMVYNVFVCLCVSVLFFAYACFLLSFFHSSTSRHTHNCLNVCCSKVIPTKAILNIKKREIDGLNIWRTNDNQQYRIPWGHANFFFWGGG